MDCLWGPHGAWDPHLKGHYSDELKWAGMGDFTQMTIISTTAGRNPSEEKEQPSWSTKESEMQYLDAIPKTTE